MNRIICCPASNTPDVLSPETYYFSLYSMPNKKGVGYIAPTLIDDIKSKGFEPSVEAWDFLTIALSVAAADKFTMRKDSADGWTRMIELHVYLRQPDVWDSKRTQLEEVFRYLSGDFWSIHFLSGGVEPPKVDKQARTEADSVCLLSGGIDSLVGAIDLTTTGHKPYFVSQIVRGDCATQKRFVSELGGDDRHCQWSCTIRHAGESEKTTRARSIVFFAFALIAASAIPSTTEQPVRIFVPENGFIREMLNYS